LFTGFTLGAGFKGGEATPFFYWSHIRKRLIHFVPLPIALWQEWDLYVFSELLIHYRLHDHGNGTLWNRKWTIGLPVL
jgi:hypothetical protein